jgi:ribosomal protein S27AE
MKKRNLKLLMNACPRCGGAAYLEDPHENDWRCLQCARTVPTQEIERRVANSAA